MAGQSGMWVFYYLQGEDGESVETPNAFNIMGAVSEVRLGQFLQAFPLRGHGGQYHFRFRAPDKMSGYCWMDVSDPSAVLPRYGNAICAKVLRLDRLPKPRSSRLRRKAPYGGGAPSSPVGGTTSWRSAEAQRRASQQQRQQQQQQQWSTQAGQGSTARAHSASPTTTHKIYNGDVSKGKSVTPPPSHGGGKSPVSRGPPPAAPPPPPSSENLEEFLFSDSPTGSPRSSPRPRDEGPGRSFSQGGGGGNDGGGGKARGGRAAGASAGGGKSGEDLLNFGNDSARPKQAPPPPPPRPAGSASGGSRSPVPPGWGNRPGSGAASPGRKSTSGRMQGQADGLGGANGSGGPRNNGRTNGVGGSGGAGGGGVNASNLHRPKSFSGAAAAGGGAGATGGPELMNFSSPRAGGGAGAGAGGAGGGGGQSAYVKNKVQEREQKLKANVEKALKFKDDIESAALKDQDLMDAAKAKHGAKLSAWAEDHGKKRNVRTLLSTMHTVLWEGNRWKTVSMGDIIQPSKVKMAYRKAMLLVHPDKCGSLGPEERLIAKRVFEAVNEAYTIFSEKENP